MSFTARPAISRCVPCGSTRLTAVLPSEPLEGEVAELKSRPIDHDVLSQLVSRVRGSHPRDIPVAHRVLGRSLRPVSSTSSELSIDPAGSRSWSGAVAISRCYQPLLSAVAISRHLRPEQPQHRDATGTRGHDEATRVAVRHTSPADPARDTAGCGRVRVGLSGCWDGPVGLPDPAR
jgi:hypothetical protein